MVEIKKITRDRINEVSAKTGFNADIISKDYYVTATLYLLKDVKGIYFKGGKAKAKRTFIKQHSNIIYDDKVLSGDDIEISSCFSPRENQRIPL